MSDIAIRVENLGKEYHIGGPQASYRTIRETIVDVFQAPFRRAGKLLRGQASGASELDEIIWALKDVSFEIKRGEVVGVIGRNGAGKSTLLKILSRITEPSTGYAEIHGRVGSLLEVGTGFHPELTGRDNIYLNGAILGMSRNDIARKFDEIVAFAEVERFIDTPVKHYSSGMYLRLAFAVAAHLEPEILLVDEVLAVGDAAFQRKCLGKMGEVAGEGRTVFFVSHNVGALLALCSQGVLLESGDIRQYGSIQEVVNTYLNEAINLEGKVTFPEHPISVEKLLRFISISILDDSQRPTSHAELDKGIAVDIEYEVLHPVRSAQVGFELWNVAGVCVLSSTDFDSAPEVATAIKQRGRYRVTCQVPSEYLRPGRYWIDLISSVPGVQLLASVQHAIGFEVLDAGTSVEFKLAQGRRGVVAPVLPWMARKEAF